MDAVRESGNERVTVKDLRKWQQRLGLMDWHITLHRNVPKENMATDDSLACCTYQEVLKNARIQVKSVTDANNDGHGVYGRKPDELQSVLHELLELKFCLIRKDDDSTDDRIMHQIIDDIARALAEAERSK